MKLDKIAEVYKTEPETSATPLGEPCIKANPGLAAIISSQARGSFQRRVAENLISDGWVVAYLADGKPIRGKAKAYKGRYEASVRNVMNRINDMLPGRYHIESGPVGVKGGYGYWLSD